MGEELNDVFRLFRGGEARLYVYYGDKETGKAWGDIDVGYIGRSMGPVKVWLLLHNRRSIAGPAIGESVVRVTTTRGREVYRHPQYHAPEGLDWNYCRGK